MSIPACRRKISAKLISILPSSICVCCRDCTAYCVRWMMQPYRLEMGIRLKTPKAKILYHFWGEIITDKVERSAARGAITW